MKTVVTALLLFAALIYFVSPFEPSAFDIRQVPLWIADLGWAGIEVFGVLFALLAVIAGAALISLGIIGVFALLIFALLLTILFGLGAFAWPLLLIAIVCWLVSDNKGVVS